MESAVLLESFDGRDSFTPDIGGACLTGTNRLAVNQDSAGSALALAASVLGSCELEVVPKDAQQGPFRVDVDGMRYSVDQQLD
jgi:hypothetical protein